MMITLGVAAKAIRERFGLTIEEMASEMGLLSEDVKSLEDAWRPDWMCELYEEKLGIDPSIVAWCISPTDKLPEKMRATADELTQLWNENIDAKVKAFKERKASES